jgi:hypothetical protein
MGCGPLKSKVFKYKALKSREKVKNACIENSTKVFVVNI